MRDRKTKVIVLSAIVVAIVLLTIGFAAFSNTLFINNHVAVTPNSSNFSVKFSTVSSGYTSGSIAPTATGNASGTSATIENTTADNLNATLANPGEKVTYNFYVVNNGHYNAYLTGITFGNVSGESTFKTCTPGTDTNGVGTTASLVTAACDSIKLTVKVGTLEVTDTNEGIKGHILAEGAYEPVEVTIEYLDDGAYVDGPFTINFGAITFDYSTVDNKLICQLNDGTSKEVGAEYTCSLDQNRIFYVLSNNGSTVSLIMNMNYTDDYVPITMNWCASGSNNSCNHDGLDSYITYIQGKFGNDVMVSLPSYDQIYNVNQSSSLRSTPWLYDYLKNRPHPVPEVDGYWTSSSSTSESNSAYKVHLSGSIVNGRLLYPGGLRPVITIPTSALD